MDELNGGVASVFGLNKEVLQPILEEAVGEAVKSFDVTMEHPSPEPYGFASDKEIPTFVYVTKNGSAGRVTMFVKRYFRTGPAESQQYSFLLKHQAPLPRRYGVLRDPDDREILFLEHVETQNAIETMRELLGIMARFHAIKPTTEYKAWLEQVPWIFSSRFASVGSALERTWEYAVKGELGPSMYKFCTINHCIHQLISSAKQVIDRTLQMPQGLIHSDFSRENIGRRVEGELLVLDVEWVTLGPRFFDVAERLGWPPEQSPPDLRKIELGQYYLDEYARWGGVAPSLEEFFDEVRVLWLADRLRYIDWNLNRGLGNGDTSAVSDDERRDCRDELYRTLTIFLAQYLMRGTNCSVLSC